MAVREHVRREAMLEGDPLLASHRASRTGTDEGSAQRRTQLSRTSMKFDPLMPLDTWKTIGTKLGTHANATCWWLGDWLAFGQTKYGRRYKEGVAVTGLKYQTLRNYAMVARCFDVSRRRDNLSFQHHAEVIGLPPEAQDCWLDLAAEHRWSKAELRRRLRADAVGETGGSNFELHLVFELERDRTWREAAARRQCSLEDWIVRVLDEAATSELLCERRPDD